MSDLSSQIDELFESLDKPSEKKVLEESSRPKDRKVYIDPHALDGLFDDSPTAHEIHDLVEEIVEDVIEEVEEPPQPVVPEVRKTRQERMAENLSLFYKKTDQVVDEVAPTSESQRIKLLEDAFAQMRSAQPATLVSGIGASLDSGGGAVWLWDLDDVNIGTPTNGAYPNIEDGAVLKYDRDNLRWEPGAPGGGSGMGPITDTYLDFDGTDTAQAIRAYGATDKVFEIEVGDTQQDTPIVARFESSPNKLVLPSGQLECSDISSTAATINTLNTGTIQGSRIGVLWKLSAGEGLAFDGQASGHIGGTPGETGGNAYSVGFGTLKVGATVLQTTGTQVILGDKTYTGSTSEAKSLQTKDSVNTLISSAISDGFTFRGTTDVTGTAPSSPGAGDFYINLVAGEAAVSWTGIAGATISADQLVIYSGSESRWFAGTVEDNSTFLAKTGGTMTGDIVFAGSQTFPSSLTAAFLPKSGGTMTGTLTTDEIEVPSGKTLTIKRGNNNTSSSGLDIKGYAPNQVGTLTDIFGVSYGNGSSTGDSINYKGRTDGNNNLQTKASVQSLINDIAPGNFVAKSGDTMTGDLQIDIASTNPSNIALEIEEDGNTNFRVLRTGFVSSKVITCTGVTANGSVSIDSTLSVTGITDLDGQFKVAGNISVDDVAASQSIDVRGQKLKELFIYTPDNSGNTDGALNKALTVGYTANQSHRPFAISGANTNGSDSLAQTGRLAFTGSCDDGFISKSNGTNNLIKIGGGTPAASHVVATIGVLQNGNRTFTSSVGSSDFIGTQTVWNKAVAQSYNVVNGTSATYDNDGNLTAATIGAPIIHSSRLESHSSLSLINCEDAETNNVGALRFKWKDSTTQNNQSHILFQGSGDTDAGNPGTFTFARDTATNNVASTDKYFSLIAPRGNHSGVKTVFNMPVEGLTPMTDAQLATKGYVDSEITLGNTGNATRSGTFKLTKDRTNTVGGGPLTIAPANSSNEWGFRVDSADNLNFDSKVGSYSELIWFEPDGGANFSGRVVVATPTAAEHATTKAYVDNGATSFGGEVGSDGTISNMPFNHEWTWKSDSTGSDSFYLPGKIFWTYIDTDTVKLNISQNSLTGRDWNYPDMAQTSIVFPISITGISNNKIVPILSGNTSSVRSLFYEGGRYFQVKVPAASQLIWNPTAVPNLSNVRAAIHGYTH